MSLRVRLVVLFTTMIAGVAALQIGLNLWSSGQAEKRYNQSLLDNYKGHWEKVIELQTDSMMVEQKSLTRDRDVLKALRKNNLEDVHESAFPSFNRLSASGVVDSLRIFSKSGELAYSSNTNSEKISQRTTDAMQSQEVRAGLLVSSEGMSILEFAFPLYYRGKLIGAAQYSKLLTTAIEEFSNTTRTNSLLLLPSGRTSIDPKAISNSIELDLTAKTSAFVNSQSFDKTQHLVSAIPIENPNGGILAFLVSAKDDEVNYQQSKLFKLIFFGSTIAVLIISITTLGIILRSSLKPLTTAIKTLRDIEAGDLETQAWKGNWKGEFSELMAELGIVQQQLLNKTQSELRYAKEINRTIKSLDRVSNAIMVSDSDGKIVYTNPSANALLTRVEAKIRTRVPEFDASNLMGADIDIFSMSTSNTNDTLSDRSQSNRYEIAMDGCILEIISNSVTEHNGTQLGTVVEWRDLTEERIVVDEVKNVVASAQAGNLRTRVSVNGKTGVFLELSKSTNDMIEMTEAVIDDSARVLAALAQGDLTESISKHYDGSYGQLKDDVNRTVQNLKEVVSTIHHSTFEVQHATNKIDAGNQNLGVRTEQTANYLQETSISIEKMMTTVHLNAENSERANALVLKANTEAQNGGRIVQYAITAMHEINESSSKISDITGVINDIAFQTNLLALNAAVESARAGEHGKGFAVVASEVRNLASRCSIAAKEIQGLIETSIEKVDKGQQLVNQSGTTLNDIVSSIKEISGLVGEISVSGKEQAIGLEKINEAISQVDDSTQENAAMVKQVSQASSRASQQTNELNDTIAFFKLDEVNTPSPQSMPREHKGAA